MWSDTSADVKRAVWDYRKDLFENGYRPVPIYTGTKRPKGEGWQKRAQLDAPDAVVFEPDDDACSTGVSADGLLAMNSDINDPVLAAHAFALIKKKNCRLPWPGPPSRRFGALPCPMSCGGRQSA